MNAILKSTTLILLLSMFFGLPALSQVTIGALSSPLKGALLDLKQNDDPAGGSTSTKGMMYPRVVLSSLTSLSPLDDAPASLTQYKGMTVYNVAPAFPEGLYIWDGAKWNLMSDTGGINATNGLTFANDSIKLGGTLDQPTTIDLNSNDLLFSRSTGNVGIGTTGPQAILHLKDEVNDPLIIDSLKFTSDPKHSVNDTVYYNMQISNGGVVRRSPIINHLSEKYIYTLSPQVTIATGDNYGNNGTQLKWVKDTHPFDYITLPEDGAYVFSLRLYGTTTNTTNMATSYYVSAFKNSMTQANLADVQEIIITTPINSYLKATYTVNLTLAGKAKDQIYIKIGELSGRALTWTLLSGGESSANRTSMIFWKI